MNSVSFPLFFDGYLLVMKDYLNQLALELNKEPPLLSKAWANLVCSFDNENLKSKRIFELVGDFACKSSIKLSELHTSMKCASQASIEAERRVAEREISRLKSLLKEANEKNSLLLSEKDYLALEIARLQESFSSESDVFNTTIIETRDQLLKLEYEKMNIEKEKIDLDLLLSETNSKMSTFNAEMENLKSTMEDFKLQEMNTTSLSNTALEINSNLSPPADASPVMDPCPLIETSPSTSIHTLPSSIHTSSENFIGFNSAIDSTPTYSTPVMDTSAAAIPSVGSIPPTVSSSDNTTISYPSEIRVSPSIVASPFTSDFPLIEDSPAVNIPPSLHIHSSPIQNPLSFETVASVSSSPSSSIANSVSLSTNFVLHALALPPPPATIANDSILLTASTPNSVSNSAAMYDSLLNSINLSGSVSPSNDPVSTSDETILTSNDAISTSVSHSSAVIAYASTTEHVESSVLSSNSAKYRPNFTRVPVRLKFLFGSEHGSSLVNEFFPHLN